MWHNLPEEAPPKDTQLLLYIRFHAYGTEWHDYAIGQLTTTWEIHYLLDYASFFVIAWKEIEPYEP